VSDPEPDPEALYVGLDLGGTKLLAAVVTARGEVVDEQVAPTAAADGPRAATELEDRLVGIVDRLRERASGPVRAVGLGAAGLVDVRRGVVLHAAHLPWRDEPVRERLARRTGLPVLVDNDATSAAWAEHRFGAARGVADAVLVALGTGIGGAVVAGGELRRGRTGLAGEFGHVPVETDGRACPCGQRGCWERYCSGSALTLLTGRSGPEVVARAAAGDRTCREALDEVGRWLGVGLVTLVATLDPEMVVVGGGLGVEAAGLLPRAEAHLRTHLSGAAHRPLPELRYAALGPRAGVVGAAGLAAEADAAGRLTPPA